MNTHHSIFDINEVLHEIKHFLPIQAPLKDFVAQNILVAFQDQKFYDALRNASKIFGYRVQLSLHEYRSYYISGRIRKEILHKIISDNKGADSVEIWQQKMLHTAYDESCAPRVGRLRAIWEKKYHIDLDSLVHPMLFRILCSYLDQGVAIRTFPVLHRGFLTAMRELEKNTFTSFFKTRRAKRLLLDENIGLEDLLSIVVGDENYYKQYLYDQQFAHQGWSGMVSVIENQPHTLLDDREISTHDLIFLDLLLEIDALDDRFGEDWQPIATRAESHVSNMFAPVPVSELNEVIRLWQEAFEWSYYDQVLAGMLSRRVAPQSSIPQKFQAMFCIDDRECSIRRYVEQCEPACATYGTPGFFGVEFYFKPEYAMASTKQCPLPVKPAYLIKEYGTDNKPKKDVHFQKQTHSLFSGWLSSQTLGFTAAVRLITNAFKPDGNYATSVSAMRHIDKNAHLTIENQDPKHREDGLQIGFTVQEMVDRIERLLKSIGLVDNFAPLIYVIGHGASSANNPYYAAYDCGACAGRPGSINARVAATMGNHPKVREILKTRGLDIPEDTQFLGGLHDTTRDEISFYDEDILSHLNKIFHADHKKTIDKALALNAKERARRFVSVDVNEAAHKVHKKVKMRSVALFETRPELTHTSNALCIVGRRNLTKNLFLDRRAFLNSYDYQVDATGDYLFTILKAAAPVCGGINLEYYFSRVDNHRLGSGTKLPHNVMGLFGVANGIEGDLRPGLPSQMVEAHEPVRMFIVVEHKPEVVLEVIKRAPETYQWFKNEWLHLAVINPETQELYVLKNEQLVPYKPLQQGLETITDVAPLLSEEEASLPVYVLQ
jgi:uncharacterized protein YbcC (UPF0753/DUF2309 family)